MSSFALRFTLVSALSFAAVACASAPPSDLFSTSAADTAREQETETIIVTASASAPNGHLKASVSLGFEDSSHDNDTKGYCFVGKLDDVCNVVAAAAHDGIEIQSCTTTPRTSEAFAHATVKYHLNGGKDVERTITACDVALAQSADPSGTRIFMASVLTDVKAGKISAFGGVGFEDSTFDGDTKAFCYQGNADDVCGLVRAYAAEMQKQYASGGHDTIDLSTCTVDGAKVTTTYNLSDDYGGDDNETRVIEKCAETN
jgi:hypothetical protein